MTVAGLVTCASVATAQTAKGAKKPGEMPTVESLLEYVSGELKLTDVQKPKVKAVLEDTAKKVQEVASSSLPREQMMEKAKAGKDEENRKMKEILTAEQFEKWKAIQSPPRSGSGGGEKKKNKKG